ncbi:MAG: hypothetical protein KDD22_06770 [Bdellovibrionales bacterium]|nr:hypothetical protein [Bdellovibrionales bacterium]
MKTQVSLVALLIAFTIPTFAKAGVLSKCLASVECQLLQNTPKDVKGNALCEPADDVLIDVQTGEIWLQDEDEIAGAYLGSSNSANHRDEIRLDVLVEGDIQARKILVEVDSRSCDIKNLETLNY